VTCGLGAAGAAVGVAEEAAAVVAEPRVAAERRAAGAEVARVRAEAVGRDRAVVHREVALADHATLLHARRRCRGRQLPTLSDRVAAKLQIIDPRWATCRRLEIAQLQVREIDPARAMSPIDQTRVPGPPEATSQIARTSVSPAPAIDQAPVQDRSPHRDRLPVHDHRHAMCKTFSICQVPELEILAEAGHQVDSATRPQLLVAL
jgi:hypothetical protein